MSVRGRPGGKLGRVRFPPGMGSRPTNISEALILRMQSSKRQVHILGKSASEEDGCGVPMQMSLRSSLVPWAFQKELRGRPGYETA